MTPAQQLEYVAQWEAWQQYYQHQQQVRGKTNELITCLILPFVTSRVPDKNN